MAMTQVIRVQIYTKTIETWPTKTESAIHFDRSARPHDRMIWGSQTAREYTAWACAAVEGVIGRELTWEEGIELFMGKEITITRDL